MNDEIRKEYDREVFVFPPNRSVRVSRTVVEGVLANRDRRSRCGRRGLRSLGVERGAIYMSRSRIMGTNPGKN